jgi:hypothetical protein
MTVPLAHPRRWLAELREVDAEALDCMGLRNELQTQQRLVPQTGRAGRWHDQRN